MRRSVLFTVGAGLVTAGAALGFAYGLPFWLLGTALMVSVAERWMDERDRRKRAERRRGYIYGR